jgi:ubiquitin carboxyl-terminal hydrolase 25/28
MPGRCWASYSDMPSYSRPYKCNAFVKFDQTLYMDRFLPNADLAKKMRSQQLTRDVMKARQKLASLRESKVRSPSVCAAEASHSQSQTLVDQPRPVAETMNCLLDVLAKLNDDFDTEGLQGTLRVESEKIERNILAIETNIADMTTELEALWSESKEFAYELSSIFMHR